MAVLQGDYAAGKRLLQESLAVFREIDDPIGVSHALGGLAYLSIEQGHYPEAEVPSRESVDCARVTDNRWGLFSSLGYQAIALHRQGQRAVARVVRAGTRGGARARNPVGNRSRS